MTRIECEALRDRFIAGEFNNVQVRNWAPEDKALVIDACVFSGIYTGDSAVNAGEKNGKKN